METMSDPRRQDHSNSPDMTETTTPGGRQRHLREEAVDEFSRLVIILGYLWVAFEFLSFHKSIALSEYHLNYPEHAFAIVNFLVFGKILLTWDRRLWDMVLKLSLRTAKLQRPRETSPWAIDSRVRSLGLSSPD